MSKKFVNEMNDCDVLQMQQQCRAKRLCTEGKNTGNFYLGVDDIKVFFGKKNKMKQVDVKSNCFGYCLTNGQTRVFGEKFQKDPKRAAELVFLSQVCERRKQCDPAVIRKFWETARWDEKNKTLIYDEYLTLGTKQPPKQCQMDEFNKGNYKFILIRHEIQTLKTELTDVSKNVIDIA